MPEEAIEEALEEMIMEGSMGKEGVLRGEERFYMCCVFTHSPIPLHGGDPLLCDNGFVLLSEAVYIPSSLCT
jgi:hypothetical protein